MGSVAENLAAVEARIKAACTRVGRDPSEVRLLPVSKDQGLDLISDAYEAGVRLLGENKVQEAGDKARRFADHPDRRNIHRRDPRIPDHPDEAAAFRGDAMWLADLPRCCTGLHGGRDGGFPFRFDLPGSRFFRRPVLGYPDVRLCAGRCRSHCLDRSPPLDLWAIPLRDR